MTTTMSAREFNQDTSRAKKAADKGPVYITDRGRTAHVLLTFAAYESLLGRHSVLDLLSQPAGVAEVEIEPTRNRDIARPADFD